MLMLVDKPHTHIHTDRDRFRNLTYAHAMVVKGQRYTLVLGTSRSLIAVMWLAGTGLGAKGQGIAAPVQPVSMDGSSGLGFQMPPPMLDRRPLLRRRSPPPPRRCQTPLCTGRQSQEFVVSQPFLCRHGAQQTKASAISW